MAKVPSAYAYSFVLAGIPMEVEYRNVKAMRITVYPPDGRVRIAVRPGTDVQAIGTFAASKAGWIEKHRQKFQNNSAAIKSRANASLQNHSTVYVWGLPHKLELVERRGNPKIIIDGGRMIMSVRPLSPKAKNQEFLDRWYRRILKEAAEKLILKWEAVLGVKVQKLYTRKMKTHWGSCNYIKRTLRLNSELTKYNPECLEYVIVHEMLHIIESGHNRNFYRLLSQYIPDWKAVRKKMNSRGGE